MRYAIISDIHGNLGALEQVLRRIEAEKCDKIVCLGDLVGYGPFPNECVRRVKEAAEIVILGNHDDAVIGRTDTIYFNVYAKFAIEWTRTEIQHDVMSTLENLASTGKIEDCLLVHASPFRPLEWNYVFDLKDAKQNFDSFEEQICFIGHSHIPVVFSTNRSGEIFRERVASVKVKKGYQHIINVGSVGQPRDGNPNACFAIYDNSAGKVTIIRQEYGITNTQIAMYEKNLPDYLIKRLQHGL